MENKIDSKENFTTAEKIFEENNENHIDKNNEINYYQEKDFNNKKFKITNEIKIKEKKGKKEIEN
jgi:hypothetical protein